MALWSKSAPARDAEAFEFQLSEAEWRERLSPQKTPAYWIWVDEWPLTGSGKIQRFRLAEAFGQGAYDDQLP